MYNVFFSTFCFCFLILEMKIEKHNYYFFLIYCLFLSFVPKSEKKLWLSTIFKIKHKWSLRIVSVVVNSVIKFKKDKSNKFFVSI
jgi:hypothetical protein